MKKSRAFQAIVSAGLIVGILDITSAFVIWTLKGVVLTRGLQGMAGPLVGIGSFYPLRSLNSGIPFPTMSRP
jgi:hypothetical protein